MCVNYYLLMCSDSHLGIASRGHFKAILIIDSKIK